MFKKRDQCRAENPLPTEGADLERGCLSQTSPHKGLIVCSMKSLLHASCRYYIYLTRPPGHGLHFPVVPRILLFPRRSEHTPTEWVNAADARKVAPPWRTADGLWLTRWRCRLIELGRIARTLHSVLRMPSGLVDIPRGTDRSK